MEPYLKLTEIFLKAIKNCLPAIIIFLKRIFLSVVYAEGSCCI